MAKNAARPWGFTLVELLTVIAIIAVLATLISASLANAQRKGRKAVSTSNLRQIAVAFNLYFDDRDKRPESFRQMTETKYLSERVLLCPEDRIVKNWAGVLESTDTGRNPDNGAGVPNAGDGNGAPTYPGLRGSTDVAHSYFKSFDYTDEIWQQVDKSTMGGLAACQLHGIGRQRKDEPPRIDTFQGLVLRVLKDGSVVTRQVFWGDSELGTSMNPDEPPAISTPLSSSQLPLFLDPVE